ncbi:tryptophan synthase subunit alpha [Robertmurraya kyonggiensis]|uniref:Tryptophan synthase alpha chain n=1 Tax=Robertmurraya kyonggiensis TaxID=1037680 RepID=A0A4U1DBR3_9BACI|nr:tryptophan synthase subunit alpha [Robertmurraya kyonggiensis]TKC19503.1 tryptophan synthase subunit alpha [Robertmurraya kyonggiensis]
MNRLEKALKRTKEKNKKAFVPYIMAGDGGLDSLMERIVFLESCGATAIEVGIPFSDPVADGPTIQAAGLRSLKEGTTLKAVLETILNLRPIVSIPIIVMTYMNPIYAYGINSFIEDASRAGVDGLIVPDLPIEEEEIILSHLNVAQIELIRLVTLTSSEERIKEIAKRGQGFLYAVTVTGITGARVDFHKQVGDYLKKIQSVSPIPVLAGFGISTPEQVKGMGQYCDGVVVGSKIVDLFQENKLDEIEKLIQAAKTVNV